jgi:type 1 glutamine amidotransferase
MRRPTLFTPVLLTLALAACSDGSVTGIGGTGGRGTGGTSASGSGGSSSGSGGSGSGGNGSGGNGSGGMTSSGGSGETGSGGMTSSGGSGSGGTGTGGMTGSGGTASGGSGGSGGAVGSGGRGGGAGSTAIGGGSGSGSGGAGGGNDRPKKVLLYTYMNMSDSMQAPAFQEALTGWGYTVDTVNDPMNGMVFTDANLAKYAAVVMMNTCFFPFGNNKNDTATGLPESQALKKFVQQGGGLFGNHCAEVTFKSATTMPLYNQVLGGWAHAGNSGDNANMTCMKTADHPASMMLPADSWTYKGNVDFAEVATDTTVLVKCTYGGNTTTPVSWIRTEGTGRVFNTSFAKVTADLKDPIIGDKHILAGLGWVLGR